MYTHTCHSTREDVRRQLPGVGSLLPQQAQPYTESFFTHGAISLAQIPELSDGYAKAPTGLSLNSHAHILWPSVTSPGMAVLLQDSAKTSSGAHAITASVQRRDGCNSSYRQASKALHYIQSA